MAEHGSHEVRVRRSQRYRFAPDDADDLVAGVVDDRVDGKAENARDILTEGGEGEEVDLISGVDQEVDITALGVGAAGCGTEHPDVAHAVTRPKRANTRREELEWDRRAQPRGAEDPGEEFAARLPGSRLDGGEVRLLQPGAIGKFSLGHADVFASAPNEGGGLLPGAHDESISR